MEDLIKKGVVTHSNGAWIVDLEAEKLGVNLLVKSDGTLLYNAKDLALAVRKRQKVIVNIDNFSELKRLGEIAQAQRRKINCGVRIYTQYHGVWHKFGIALADLKKFWQQAKKYPYLNLQGIQFHLSLNYSALPYQNVIKELAKYLRRHFSPSELQQIKFIDFGGGFMPHLSEGVYSHFTPRGKIIKTANDYFQKPSVFKDKYYFTKTATAAEFAQGIAAAVNKHLKPLVSCVYFAEPGRIIANSAMHILLRVVDVKDKENVVVDGGINIVGHERYEEDYFPIINLTRPAKKEIDCRVWGPLCLPDDYWGYYVYAAAMKEGDYLLVPSQGCLTYALAQEFIKPIPPVHLLK